MGTLSYIPTPEAVEAAWDRYDAARIHASAIEADPNSTRQERFDAAMEAVRLHQAFFAAASRMEAA